MTVPARGARSPATRPPSSRRQSSAMAPSRTSAPALAAASRRRESRSQRRGAIRPGAASVGRIGTTVPSEPYWKRAWRTQGVPARRSWSRRPQDARSSTAGRISAWVESVSPISGVAVDEQHPGASAGEEKRGRGAGDPGADDHRVVDGVRHRRALLRLPPAGRGRRPGGRRALRRRAPAPEMCEERAVRR